MPDPRIRTHAPARCSHWAAAGSACLIVVLLAVTPPGAGAATKSGASLKPVPRASAGEAPRVSGDERTPVPGGRAPAKDLTLEGDSPGTVFRTLTVEGEDRIQIEIQRPGLRLDLDPASAPGLELGGAEDVMNRTRPDLTRALLDAVSAQPAERVGRPWLESFATGPVARFRPELTDVESWSLTVTDARGRTAARFDGRGTPPREIEWDGRGESGAGAALPGLTYSYALEARDKAGNRRHFVGDGFEVPAYRVMGAQSVRLSFPGDALQRGTGASGSMASRDPLLAEAASWVNQMPAAAPVEIRVTARTHARGDAIARQVQAGLEPLLVGDPARVRQHIAVEPDAPAGGAVRVQAGR